MTRLSASVDHTYFHQVDSEEKAYWLGFIAADGCVTGRDGQESTLAVLLGRKDQGHLSKLKDALKYGGEIKIRTVKRYGEVRGTACSLLITSRSIALDLMANGVTPRKSLTLNPWNGAPELMRHWWRGLLDGDGWIARDPQYRQWKVGCCGSVDVIHGFREFLATQGIFGGYMCNPIPNHWRLNFNGVKSPQSVARLLYGGATVYLERKMLLAKQLMAEIPLRERVTQDLDIKFIQHLYDVHGSLRKVAGVLGIKPPTLVGFCNRNGLYVRGKRDGSTAVLAVAG